MSMRWTALPNSAAWLKFADLLRQLLRSESLPSEARSACCISRHFHHHCLEAWRLRPRPWKDCQQRHIPKPPFHVMALRTRRAAIRRSPLWAPCRCKGCAAPWCSCLVSPGSAPADRVLLLGLASVCKRLQYFAMSDRLMCCPSSHVLLPCVSKSSGQESETRLACLAWPGPLTEPQCCKLPGSSRRRSWRQAGTPQVNSGVYNTRYTCM